MRVIGIDPGFATTGYGVVDRAGGKLVAVAIGVVRTPRELPQAGRLARLRMELMGLIAEHAPASAAVERVFFNVNVKTAIGVGQASGVALEVLGAAGVPVTEYTPLEVKQSVTGVGNADKEQVQRMVAALLGLATAPRPADAADAAALAVCHLSRRGYDDALRTALAR